METIIFDENGDLTLLLEDGHVALTRALHDGEPSYTRKYIVSSNTMRLISPVWRAMLSGRFKEGTETNTIPLPEDDHKAFEYILNLAHFKYDVLWEPDVHEISNIAKLCDKYDMIHLCRFRTSAWHDKLKATAHRRELMAYAWIFGFQDTLASAIKGFIMEEPFGCWHLKLSICPTPGDFEGMLTNSRLCKYH